MRAYIDLVESLSPPTLQQVEAVANHLFHGFHESEPTEADVARVYREIRGLFARGSRTLYRFLFLTPEALAALSIGGRLSRDDASEEHHVKIPFSSWASDWREMSLDSLNVSGWDTNGEKFFVVEADVPTNSVEMLATIAQRIELPWEHEICVTKDRPVRIRKIYELEELTAGHRLGKVVRPDLSGKVMQS